METSWKLLLFCKEACHSTREINAIFIVHDYFETLSLFFLFYAETATNEPSVIERGATQSR